MSLFLDLCRESGSILHHLLAPVSKPAATAPTVEKVKQTVVVEEKRVNEKMILRRTTIEEIEIQRSPEQSP